MILKCTLANIIIVKLMVVKVLIVKKAINSRKNIRFCTLILRVVLIEAKSESFVQYLPSFKVLKEHFHEFRISLNKNKWVKLCNQLNIFSKRVIFIFIQLIMTLEQFIFMSIWVVTRILVVVVDYHCNFIKETFFKRTYLIILPE